MLINRLCNAFGPRSRASRRATACLALSASIAIAGCAKDDPKAEKVFFWNADATQAMVFPDGRLSAADRKTVARFKAANPTVTFVRWQRGFADRRLYVSFAHCREGERLVSCVSPGDQG